MCGCVGGLLMCQDACVLLGRGVCVCCVTKLKMLLADIQILWVPENGYGK